MTLDVAWPMELSIQNKGLPGNLLIGVVDTNNKSTKPHKNQVAAPFISFFR
jgi:hypothetical protein